MRTAYEINAKANEALSLAENGSESARDVMYALEWVLGDKRDPLAVAKARAEDEAIQTEYPSTGGE